MTLTVGLKLESGWGSLALVGAFSLPPAPPRCRRPSVWQRLNHWVDETLTDTWQAIHETMTFAEIMVSALAFGVGLNGG